ncbi:hypothetical protein L7F22_014207 [Adiantum nelumboides]|nr:hypothetical protein [Adiantum nelumboides]
MFFSVLLLRHRQSLFHFLHTGLVQYLQKCPALQNGCQIQQESVCRKANSEPTCLENSLYREDDSLWTVLSSIVKIVTCFSAMLITTFFWTFIMVLLLPFPYARIKQGNMYGHVTGRLLMWILGNPIKIRGAENANLKAIYVCNHASPLDIVLVMWLTPTGTVGIAKKEIIWYPLFGQLYVLANHLRIDRTNTGSSIQSLRKIAKAVVDQNLSLILFPEGTRSATGRLLPFKKGFVHLAIQTKRPIVPMVLTGTHLGWQKNSLRVRPAPLTVTYLPPIKTDDWTVDKVEEYVDMLHALYAKHLPPSQKPLEMVASSDYQACTEGEAS